MNPPVFSGKSQIFGSRPVILFRIYIDMKRKNHQNGDRQTIRLSPVLQAALRLYMQDRYLDNISEVIKSALGQFLEREGYLRQADTPDRYVVVEKRFQVDGQ